MAPIKKITRSDIAKMSFIEVMRVSREPYKKLLAYLKPYKGRFALGILFGALYGFANAVLIFTVKDVAAAVFPDSTRGQHVTHIPFLAPPEAGEFTFMGVLLICASIPAIMILRGTFSYLNSYCMLWVSLRVLDDIRTRLFRRLMAQSMEFYNHAKTGELIQVVFNQTRMAQSALTTIASDMIKQPVSILSAVVALLIIDWRFTLGALLLFPICLVPVVIVGKKVRKSGTREEQEAGTLVVSMQEAFAGIRVVKTHAREDHECGKFNRANEKMMQMIMRWRKAMELVGPLVEAIASVGVAAALLYAWVLDLGVAKFMALSGALVLLYGPFKALSRMHILMQKCIAATTKVFEFMEREPAIQDAPDAVDLQDCRGDIEFRGVTFAYGKGPRAVRQIRLTVPPGSRCALVGVSGSGKSTVLSLLLRLYDPEKGTITIDGRDIRELTQKSLRENIGIVSQDTFLFHDTIANNIRYGRLEATQEEVEAAAMQANAHEFILAQPDGYETVIGDKGCMLSGGQQQRLSIARALLKNAPILLLDEATSALDSESEQQIQAALDRLAEGRTVIAIAHRLSTILNADQIVVLETGRVVESGTHQELFEKSGVYRRLYDMQFNHRPEEEQPELATLG